MTVTSAAAGRDGVGTNDGTLGSIAAVIAAITAQLELDRSELESQTAFTGALAQATQVSVDVASLGDEHKQVVVVLESVEQQAAALKERIKDQESVLVVANFVEQRPGAAFHDLDEWLLHVTNLLSMPEGELADLRIRLSHQAMVAQRLPHEPDNGAVTTMIDRILELEMAASPAATRAFEWLRREGVLTLDEGTDQVRHGES